ncbi:MAG: type II toxin-antitoxin system MqsA family antitoxin, partial [Rhodospirillaceae bacterium]|nr:type II toxin-antitoxin system MqsA family antitoxin [Rhodospirillaceae bacterium]
MATQHDLSGDDIRAIRLGLELTQVEAGELIGGGPRAFAKYEAGAVQPSAAVRRLLRLLQADPAAIDTLRGNSPHPRSSASTGPFAVTGDHVASLSERLFPKLLRSLLSSEAQAHDLPADRMHVAGNIHAPDGGEDGYIAWSGESDWTPFLPSRRCQFQLKASAVSPSVAARDVLTGGGNVKDMVRSHLQAGGHYILLTTHRYARIAIERRAAAILQAVRSAGLHVAAHQIQVRDADQIADWVNCHPAVATWLREQTRPGTSGPFRSWNRWAERSEHERSPWVEDERLPRLRAWLLQRGTESQSSAHVVGRVGVGKSRLVHEALSPGDENGTFGCSPSDLVLYANESEVGARAIYSAVQSLSDAGTRAVIVVDDCTNRTRAILTGMVSRRSSRASLITITDDIPGETPDRATFNIDQASSTVIEAILARTAPALQPGETHRLVRFSNGLPEIAIRIGQAWGRANSLALATDADLVDAYVLGRASDDRALLLKSARLLAAFGAVRVDPPEHDQLSAVARLGSQLTEADLRIAVDEVARRSAFRRRGGLVVSQPLPIALKLADRQWHAWSPAQWDSVLTGSIDPDLQIRAAKQLAFLNEFKISHRVLNHVCRTGGPFEGLAGIAAGGRAEILSSLAEIDAATVGRRIERSLRDVEDLGQITG